MKTLIYCCPCGKIRAYGNWEWKRTELSNFIRFAIKSGALEIGFSVIKCPDCIRNEAQNHLNHLRAV